MEESKVKTVTTVLSGLFVTHSIYSPIQQFKVIRLFQKRYGLRVSEVLRLNLYSLSDDYNIIVKLSKSIEFALFRDVEIYDLLKPIFEHNHNQSFTVTYKEYYNFLKSHFPSDIICNIGKNNKVTHSFRYRKAQQIKNNHNNELIIKASLHHKSKESQKPYLRTK